MAKRLLIWVASIAVLAAMPAVAQASAQFRLNGMLAGSAQQNVVAFGTVTLTSSKLGEFKCKAVAGLFAHDESEKGMAAVETVEPYDCSSTECAGPAFVTAESPPEFIEETEKFDIYRFRFLATRGASRPNLPWPAELSNPEAGKSRLKMNKAELWIVCPKEGLEIMYNGNLEPRFQNGLKNGLYPSHLVFEGKGGHTGFLSSPFICGRCEEEEDRLYVSGELTAIGTNEELVTAE